MSFPYDLTAYGTTITFYTNQWCHASSHCSVTPKESGQLMAASTLQQMSVSFQEGEHFDTTSLKVFFNALTMDPKTIPFIAQNVNW